MKFSDAFFHSAAIPPGSTIDPEIVDKRVCSKCGYSFVVFSAGSPARIDPEWCGPCNQDITNDASEDAYWGRVNKGPFVSYPTSAPYMFMGWRFCVKWLPHDPRPALMLMKHLPYPEAPGLVFSFACSHKGYEHCAAWLIAHWWEHALKICPCQHGIRNQELDEGDGGPFRQAVIESLLWYHRHSEWSRHESESSLRAIEGRRSL